jgi:hypothetical protein
MNPVYLFAAGIAAAGTLGFAVGWVCHGKHKVRRLERAFISRVLEYFAEGDCRRPPGGQGCNKDRERMACPPVKLQPRDFRPKK